MRFLRTYRLGQIAIAVALEVGCAFSPARPPLFDGSGQNAAQFEVGQNITEKQSTPDASVSPATPDRTSEAPAYSIRQVAYESPADRLDAVPDPSGPPHPTGELTLTAVSSQHQDKANSLEASSVEPVLQVGREVFRLDLTSALALVHGESPRIAFAQAQIAQAYAQHEHATTLWLPHLRVGLNYNKHDGRIQDVIGTNIDTSRGAAFGGFGANAVGAGSPAVPGMSMQFHTSDAIYQRQITAFSWEARESQAAAVVNDQLLDTALAYLALLEAHQRRAIAAETLNHGQELVKLTTNFAQAGAGTEADVDRASAAQALLENEAVRADEAAEVASARLAQLIAVDPQLILEPSETQVVPLELIGAEQVDMSELVATALSNRPELSAHRSLVCEAVNRLRREENAPWLPSVLLGVSYGAFAAGTGGQITNGADRFDFDAAAWWEIRNLGFGERAARDQARSQIDQARMRELETMDLVAREVVEARTQVTARKRQISVAQNGIAAAQRSYDRNLARIRDAQGLPIEVLQAIQALDAARREYLRAVVEYNSAQFRLQRALGWPIE